MAYSAPCRFHTQRVVVRRHSEPSELWNAGIHRSRAHKRPPHAMSALTLTTADRRGLGACIRTLASPLDHGHVDGWRSAVNREVGRLVRADQATFELEGVDGERLYSEQYDPEVLGRYRLELEPLAKRHRLRERFRRLRVADRRGLWRPNLKEYFRSEYYNDYVVPIRGYDGLFAFHALPDGRDAILYFHHERPDGPRFGDRELRLLELLYPAFQAGLNAFAAAAEHRDSLIRTVDALADATGLFDLDGRPVHRNPRMDALLQTAPEREALEARMARTARAVAATTVEGGPDGFDPTSPTGYVAVGSRPHRLTAAILGSHLLGRVFVMVTLAPAEAALPKPPTLVRRFGLTPRQAEVALLLARRRTNREVARALHISPYTARRHTEKVLMSSTWSRGDRFWRPSAGPSDGWSGDAAAAGGPGAFRALSAAYCATGSSSVPDRPSTNELSWLVSGRSPRPERPPRRLRTRPGSGNTEGTFFV